ncbi:MAG: hypothetical protein ACJA13_001784 [Paraglaciecola sp.]|jgi:hypothetical protein
MKALSISLLALALSGCEMLASFPQKEHTTNDVKVSTHSFCLYLEPQVDDEYNCQLSYWLRYWLDADDMTWEQRKAEIALLTDSGQDNLRKVLLSQGEYTPYQDRLRSQVWAANLIKEFDGGMQDLLTVMVYQPSQALLEMESALVTLSKINSAQSTRIEEQQELVDQQRSQIEQLLKIEASIMDNTKGDPQ